MNKLPKIDSWTIVNLSVPRINGIITGHDKLADGINYYTPTLKLIKDSYAVCGEKIFQLGEPDETWAASVEGNRIKEYL